MRRLWNGLNPTLRGFGIIALIAATVVVFQLYQTLFVVGALLRIAFFLAIAFVAYLFWRDRKDEIATWSARSQVVLYGSIALAVADLAAYFWPGRTTAGLDAVAFLAVLAVAGFSAWRVWRDETTYG